MRCGRAGIRCCRNCRPRVSVRHKSRRVPRARWKRLQTEASETSRLVFEIAEVSEVNLLRRSLETMFTIWPFCQKFPRSPTHRVNSPHPPRAPRPPDLSRSISSTSIPSAAGSPPRPRTRRLADSRVRLWSVTLAIAGGHGACHWTLARICVGSRPGRRPG
jgi:hypothetical protein